MMLNSIIHHPLNIRWPRENASRQSMHWVLEFCRPGSFYTSAFSRPDEGNPVRSSATARRSQTVGLHIKQVHSIIHGWRSALRNVFMI